MYPANGGARLEKSSNTVSTMADVLCGKHKANVTLVRSVYQVASVVNVSTDKKTYVPAMAVGNNPKFVPMAHGPSGANAPLDAYPVPPKPVGYADNASVRTIVNGVHAKVRACVSRVNVWRVVTAVKKNAPRLAIGLPIVLGLRHFKNVIIAAGNGATKSESGIPVPARSKATSTTIAPCTA